MSTEKLAALICVFVSIFGGMLSIITALLTNKPERPNYLRRVARKYSIRPLDLR